MSNRAILDKKVNMPLSLKLLPFDGENYSQTILSPASDLAEFGDYINSLPQVEAPEFFKSYLGDYEAGYGVTCYSAGGRLTYTTVADLLKDPDQWQGNEPTAAYLAALPKNTKVALYWI